MKPVRCLSVSIQVMQCVFALVFGTSAKVAAQSVVMREIHGFADGFNASVVGDSNHDGRDELLCTRLIPPNLADDVVFERRGINDWNLVSVSPDMGRLDDAGDGDRDGKFELLIASAEAGLLVVESVDANTYPSQIVYSNPGIGFFQAPLRYADDLDRDGAREIVFSTSSSAGLEVVVLENTADDSYQEVARPVFSTGSAYPGQLATGDFDDDGKGDIVVGDSSGNIYVIANRADNAYELVWHMNLMTRFNVDGLGDLGDADGDGRHEFAVAASDAAIGARLWVFESVGLDQYVPVFVTSIPTCTNDVRAADVDGDGRNEIVLGNGTDVEIWKAIADDTWTMVWAAPARGRDCSHIVAADLNQNGFAEVLYTDPDLAHSHLVEWPWRVDASQNDVDRPGDVLFTFRDRPALRQITILVGSRNVGRRIRDWLQQGNPNVLLSQNGDETVLRLNLPGLGVSSGRQIRFAVSAQDRQSLERFSDVFTYTAP
ncbi:MAG: VCBS repeat-containing protein [Planctomycetes bacterium]|nr:VCBS repeat-containing protein [Planctomycetota bacterium]MBI3844031.1 VCBS repeat-containing protein [Planctomycetota bacterium]